MTYEVLGKFLPANGSINIIYRWNLDQLVSFDWGANAASSFLRF